MLHYAPARRGFTQRGAVYDASWRPCFTLYFKTGQSESLLDRIDTNAHAQTSCHGIPRQAAHFFYVFCSQSLDLVHHFKRWLPHRGTESLSLPLWLDTAFKFYVKYYWPNVLFFLWFSILFMIWVSPNSVHASSTYLYLWGWHSFGYISCSTQLFTARIV